jgi:hypothetical protein
VELKSKFVELKEFSVLIDRTQSSILGTEDSKKEEYFTTRQDALSTIYAGYTVLPPVYIAAFVDPLKDLFTNFFDDISKVIKLKNNDVPYRDWLDCIQQRKMNYLLAPTHAFEQVVNDLFDGWLSAEERIDVKPPDNQTVSPLVRWGSHDDTPYTIPARNAIVEQFKVKMSVITMPPSYSKNIALWGTLAHECGHDIVNADNGLLSECKELVYSQILNAPELKGYNVVYNGREEPFSKRAAEVWKYWMDETVADVLGILNFGPAAGISALTFLMSSAGGELSTVGIADDIHPIDALRVYLAADVIRDIPSLDKDIADSWSDALVRTADKYLTDRNNFTLIAETPLGTLQTVTFPFEPLRNTAKIVARTLAFTQLKTLENHYLSEINTWTREDEIVTNRIADELLSKKEPSLDSRSGEAVVYPAHIISGAVISLSESAQISDVTNLAISALNKSYDMNPVWNGFPTRYGSDLFTHKLRSNYMQPKVSQH